MVHITLTPDEAAILRDTLAYCLSDLRTEIAHTDNRDYRDMLKRQAALLRKLQIQIEAQGPQVPAFAKVRLQGDR